MSTWTNAVFNPFASPEPKEALPTQAAPSVFPPQPPNLGIISQGEINNWPEGTKTHNDLIEAVSLDWHTLTPDLAAPFALAQPTDGMTPEQVELLTEWEKTQAQLKTLKAYEMELRKCVVYQGGWFDAAKTSGTQHVELDGGYKLTAVKSENYNLNSDLVDDVLKHFSDDLAKLLVSWKATLSVSTYKKLSADQQALFNGCLEITNGAPKLEIKPPKTSA